jgi:hypothetical protein
MLKATFGDQMQFAVSLTVKSVVAEDTSLGYNDLQVPFRIEWE